MTVNGEDWGLFLAVEEPEEAFAQRVYGLEYGQLYQPDYRSLEEENADVALQYLGETRKTTTTSSAMPSLTTLPPTSSG